MVSELAHISLLGAFRMDILPLTVAHVRKRLCMPDDTC